ncbi:MAG: hypothetical protein WAZ21_02385 [Candidatus Saccharimonadales bacterium]
MKQLVAMSKNNISVFVDYEATNVTFHIRETPDLLDLVREAIEASDIVGEGELLFERNMGRIVGTTSLVETTDADDIIYAKRKEREKYSRFAKNRELVPTSYIVICIRKQSGDYLLWTAWCGRLLPKEAYDPASHFSRTHALVYDEELIQLDTITTLRP